jgi:2-keto-4-pentenoate hydratase/2-oxohepta-3-ene-1,7-dioic acid hydratase in catechol pathway
MSGGFFFLPSRMPSYPIRGLEPLEVHSIFCIGRNYAEHARELNNPIPDRPVVFTKPRTTLVEDGGTVRIPATTEDVHHEVELVVAIGTGGRNIPHHEALNHVAGYAVGLDMTARDIQSDLKAKAHPWDLAKGLDTFAPLGPFVPASRVSDPSDLALSLFVNGVRRQIGNTRDMLHSVPALVSFLSAWYTLTPGDLIFTGTPAGVGAVRAGDVMRAELGDHLSVLTVRVTAG